MPAFGAVKRRDLIEAPKKAGFEGPFAGGKHEFLVKGNLRLVLPSAVYGVDSVRIGVPSAISRGESVSGGHSLYGVFPQLQPKVPLFDALWRG